MKVVQENEIKCRCGSKENMQNCALLKDFICGKCCVGIGVIIDRIKHGLLLGEWSVEELSEKEFPLYVMPKLVSSGLKNVLVRFEDIDWKEYRTCIQCRNSSDGRAIQDISRMSIDEIEALRKQAQPEYKIRAEVDHVKGNRLEKNMVLRQHLNTENGVLNWIDEYEPFVNIIVTHNDEDVTSDFYNKHSAKIAAKKYAR